MFDLVRHAGISGSPAISVFIFPSQNSNTSKEFHRKVCFCSSAMHRPQKTSCCLPFSSPESFPVDNELHYPANLCIIQISFTHYPSTVFPGLPALPPSQPIPSLRQARGSQPPSLWRRPSDDLFSRHSNSRGNMAAIATGKGGRGGHTTGWRKIGRRREGVMRRRRRGRRGGGSIAGRAKCPVKQMYIQETQEFMNGSLSFVMSLPCVIQFSGWDSLFGLLVTFSGQAFEAMPLGPRRRGYTENACPENITVSTN